ncbi:MAG: acetyl-CoA carboxylase biotin carboxylase subunit [bacterium]
MTKKILIVNRGEIAVRIIKACRELGITSAVIYSEADKNSNHVRLADEAYYIGLSPASESYLNSKKIIELAVKIGAWAIHPGYGFLSENYNFIKLVEESGITFIGPSSGSVRLMGEKTTARKLMKSKSVPIVPGTTEPVIGIDAAKKIADEIGYPIMIKAAGGGGGKGMRKVSSEDELQSALERAGNESMKSFGNPDIYIEKYIENPKHIEVQIFGDKHGNYIHMFERECSIQRRHQKIIEEAPSSSIDEFTREKITTAAVEAARACSYYNAGTVEFLMDKNMIYYFLEMNTRLQVEHPVTEMITGLDLVKLQIKVAAGEPLPVKQNDLKISGHSIECRIYAEDIDNNFAPSIGKIIHHKLPSGPGIRVDRGIDLLSDVSVYYDPLLSKLATHGRDRDEAICRMDRALSEYQISGVITNITACKWIISHPKFIDSTFDINFIENELLPLIPGKWKTDKAREYELVAATLAALLKSKDKEVRPMNLECHPSNKWSCPDYA